MFLFYELIGQGHAWLFANVDSIFLRGPALAADLQHEHRQILKIIGPLVVAGALASWLFRSAPGAAQRHFVGLWALAACGGVLIFGCRYTHYLLPTLAPLALVNCLLWSRAGGRFWLVLFLIIGTLKAQKHIHNHSLANGNAATYRALLAAMPEREGCLFIYDGPTALYDTAHWCGVTNHPFPAHFNEQSEAHATGMNPSAELDHVFARKPLYIMVQAPPPAGDNQTLRRQLRQTLAREYKEIYHSTGLEATLELYQRTPAAP